MMRHAGHQEGWLVCKHTHGEFGLAAAAGQHIMLTIPNGESGPRETKSGAKWGYRGGPVVRTIRQEWPHSAAFRPLIRSGKRMSRLGVLAEGSLLATNILFAVVR
jgi:hypothetical protein